MASSTQTTAGAAARFRFIANALNADGPFRPRVEADGTSFGGQTCLIRYPRESDLKFARRNQVAWYASPLARVCSRFVAYLSSKPVARDLSNELYKKMGDDIDGKGNSLSVWMQMFNVEAKARGSMLLLVDMPRNMPASLGAQIAQRAVPFWSMWKPEDLTDYAIGDDGKFIFCELSGTYTHDDGQSVDCVWRFDRNGWTAKGEKGAEINSGAHDLGECQMLIFVEAGDFPNFGPFSAIADIAKRLFNLDSELDEILRSQTFSLLTMQVGTGTTPDQKVAAANTAGVTIGTNNLLVHEGSTPSFIAPGDGPATVYMQRIDKLRDQIDEIGLSVATINQQESGIAMQARFAAINAELARYAERVEDFERRAWDLSRRWLKMATAPTISWPREFNVSDVKLELDLLAQMQAAAMPPSVIVEQMKKIVSIGFGYLDPKLLDKMHADIDLLEHEADMLPEGEGGEGEGGGNVVKLPTDRNSAVRDALMAQLSG